MTTTLDYVPPKTIADFMRCDASVRAVIGPMGSGKTMGALMELFRRSCQQQPDANGIRPSRWAIVRNTSSQIRDTVLVDLKEYFPFAVHKIADQVIQFRLPLQDSTFVTTDWLLVPLERPEDQRKLLSLPLTGAFIEECREVPFDIIKPLFGRCGRYPHKKRVPPTWRGIIMSSNPWSEGSEYHDAFVINKREDWELFHQPGGLTPEAENRENLPENYYENLAMGRASDWVNVHVHSMFGEDQFGQAVYRHSFNKKIHCARGLIPYPGAPLICGIDFGRTPSAVIGQEDAYGRLLIFRELCSEDMGLHAFCRELLLPLLHKVYPHYRIFIVGDPAGTARSQYTEETAYDVLRHYGLEAIPAPTNDISQRVRAVEKRLLDIRGTATEPTAALLIDEDNCPKLVAGFLRDYRFKKRRDGELEPTPEKNEASHIHDACQYIALGAQSNYIGRRIMMKASAAANTIRKHRFDHRAWT